MCSNGNWVNSASACQCTRYSGISMQAVNLGTGPGTRRRFVSRTNVAISFNIAGPNSNANYITVSIPQNIGTAAADANGGCVLSITSAPDSEVMAANVPAAPATPTAFFVSPVAVVSLVTAGNTTLGQPAWVPCPLNPTVPLTVTFNTIEPSNSSAALQCSYPWTLSNSGSNATAAWVATSSPATGYGCAINGTQITALAVGISVGATASRQIVAPVPPTPSTPTPTSTTTGPTPTGGTGTPTPTVSATPTNGTSGSASKGSPASALSTSIAAIFLVILAALF
jgi:hypothetical protein